MSSVEPSPQPDRGESPATDVTEVARTFLLAVAHDLRNPLARVAAATHLLEQRTGEAPDAEVVALLSRSVASVQHVMADLLGFERLVTPAMGATRTTTALGPLVERCIADSVHSPVVAVLPDAPAHVDAGLVERILANLLVNAERHNPEGAPIHLTITSSDDVLTLTVDDRGPGIPDAEKERVFDLFVHGPGASSGVGLFLVRRFAELHGGGARAVDALGGGARLQVWLRE